MINDAIAFLPSNDTQCLQTNMRISARSENRVSTWITLTTHKNRVRLAEESIFRARYLKRVWITARSPPELRTFGPLRMNMCSWLVFWRVLARFGTRSIQFGRLRPGRALESPKAVQSNGAFWSMRTGNCVLGHPTDERRRSSSSIPAVHPYEWDTKFINGPAAPLLLLEIIDWSWDYWSHREYFSRFHDYAGYLSLFCIFASFLTI